MTTKVVVRARTPLPAHFHLGVAPPEADAEGLVVSGLAGAIHAHGRPKKKDHTNRVISRRSKSKRNNTTKPLEEKTPKKGGRTCGSLGHDGEGGALGKESGLTVNICDQEDREISAYVSEFGDRP
jgi:hypothetical protein